MKRISLLTTFLFCLSVPFASAQETIQEELDALFSKEFSQNEPGGSILIKKGEQVIFQKNYGLADIETKEKITEHTVFNTGSISKTFVANGILILKERDLLLLDESINKYFVDFSNPSISEKVKIKHLLSHSSGLPDIRKVRANPEFYLTAKDVENFEPIKGAKKLEFEPGSGFQYSNPAFNGLALIIEHVTKQRWQSFIQENIFTPAGMSKSTITNGPHPQEGVAHAYVKQGNGYVESDYGEVPTFAAAGNGGVWSTVMELAKYEKAIRSYAFLSEQLVQKSREVLQHKNWTRSSEPFLGYGWFIGQKDEYGIKYVYHTGSQGGFRAFFYSIPEKDLVYIALFNRPVDSFQEFVTKGMALLKKYDWLEE